MTHTYQITGMTCDGCRKHVEETLAKVSGVVEAQVDLSAGEAQIEMNRHVDLDEMKHALEQDGGRYGIDPPGTHATSLAPLPAIGKRSSNGSSAKESRQTTPSGQTTDSKAKYYCPMLCEGDKKYDKPGDCPKCGMDLDPEAVSTTRYTCPMHPEIVEDGPGSCPICGMDLEPKAVTRSDDGGEGKAYKTMLKKFWIAVAFTIPVFFIAMSEMVDVSLSGIASETTRGWVQFALSTPVIFYACWPFF
ncbi:MAG: heavy metal-binding domain-containing protein, partial [Cyclobacteriaceae bacterium]